MLNYLIFHITTPLQTPREYEVPSVIPELDNSNCIVLITFYANNYFLFKANP